METLNWEERPFVPLERMENYQARDRKVAQRYGQIIKAFEISNRDYKYRYGRHSSDWAMRPPPSSHIHICAGYLVVRKLGTPDQYETWMPGETFDELYSSVSSP